MANQGEDWTKNIEIHHYHPQQAEFRKVINFPVLMSAKTLSISEVASVISREAFEGKPIILLDNDYPGHCSFKRYEYYMHYYC